MKKRVSIAFAVLLALLVVEQFRIPHGIQYAAPHENLVRAMLSRAWFSSFMSSSVTKRLLYWPLTGTVYAQDSCGTETFPCDGTTAAKKYQGPYQRPYCFSGVGGIPDSCPSYECVLNIGQRTKCLPHTIVCTWTDGTILNGSCQQDANTKCH
jgi:hypothetical protein